MAKRDFFTTIHSEGALLPPDLLQRIAEGGKGLDGLRPEDYHLSGERLNEAISRAWNRLQGAWANFKTARADLPKNDTGTSVTRDRWLMPLFAALDYGRLLTAQAVQLDGKSYAISHRWNNNVPIHLVGCNLDLDKRTPGAAGAAIASPHSLLQVYLNRTDEMLWGLVSNGLKLRILRDNASLTRQAFVEFDLDSMMEGELYPDFVMLYLLCHESRLEAEKPSDFWLEAWMKAAQEQGTRALEQLRLGVEHAIGHLGTGFLAHPSNARLRDDLYNGALDKQDYYRQLLRLVYRLLFLFAAEDRDLLLDPNADESAKLRYAEYYSMQRLRHLAERLKGTRHRDLFDGLRLVMQLLSDENLYADEQRELLGLPALGGWLFREEAVQAVIGCAISNRDLLEAVRSLALTYDPATHTYRPIDYKNLGPEELGSVYESLLELHPEINLNERVFSLSTAAGHERKTTGSYYTPDSLVQALLDSALNPVIAEARKSADPEAALLDLKVCDPACGSGHFLIAAARRMARALASIRTGEEEPPPAATRHAVRDVIGRCIYGVDINPMAVELCKVNLWMEALEPGKPLSFLDHRIQVGNSLLGTTPVLIAKGIPDEAFNPIEGDDKNYATGLKRQNREERKGQQTMFAQLEATNYMNTTALATELRRMEAISDQTLDGVRAREEYYHRLATSPEYVQARLLADAWCAAFVWEKRADSILPMTDLVFRRLANKEQRVIERVGGEVARLADQYQFFHWHVAFPDVFDVPKRVEDAENEVTGWNGGFSCVLGNPPWERLKISDVEFFAATDPTIAEMTNASKRQAVIDTLKDVNPELYLAWQQRLRQGDGFAHFAKSSGSYPLSAMGELNTYGLFSELSRNHIETNGRVGIIVPSGLATDKTLSSFFENMMATKSLISLFDFENRDALFPGVHRMYKFCLLTLTSPQSTKAKNLADFVFFAHQVSDLTDLDRRFQLGMEDILLVNPNTRSCPIFQNVRDAEITLSVYQRLPIIDQDELPDLGWRPSVTFVFEMNKHSHLFKDADEFSYSSEDRASHQVVDEESDCWISLYEAKQIHQFDHRYATYESGTTRDVSLEEHTNPDFTPQPRLYVRVADFEDSLRRRNVEGSWFVTYRDITNAANERTTIFCALPYVPMGNTWTLTLNSSSPVERTCFIGNMNTFIHDYLARRKVGGSHLNFYVLRQLPAFPSTSYTTEILTFIIYRVLELTYTSWDINSFACDLDYNGPPFIWDEDRRFLIGCELDALYFHLYQIARDDVDYIMETFPIVKRRDEAAYGEYRTKRVILQMYDQMEALPRINVPHPKGLNEPYLVPDVSQYETWLNPPSADPSVAHQNSERPAWLDDRPKPKPSPAAEPAKASKQVSAPAAPKKARSERPTPVSDKMLRSSLPEDVQQALTVADQYLIGNHIAQICSAAQQLGLDLNADNPDTITVSPVMSSESLMRIRLTPDDGAIRILIHPEAFAQFYSVSDKEVAERLGSGWVYLEVSQVAGWIGALEGLFSGMGR